MDKRRLLELAGIASNMNNPSQEPLSRQIPSTADSPTDAPGTMGYLDLGDDGEDTSRDPEKKQEVLKRTFEKVVPQLKEVAYKGLNAEDLDEAKSSFQEILFLLGEER